MALWDPDLYNKTLRFAAEAHKKQLMPGEDLPYLVHLTQVCQEALGALVADPTLDSELVMCCALLHDTIEDTPLTEADVREVFGPVVAKGVAALSKRDKIGDRKLEKAEQMADSLVRIKQQSREVWVVKLADRITNLQKPPRYWELPKIRRYHAEAHTILSALGSASAALTQRFEHKLVAYEKYLG